MAMGDKGVKFIYAVIFLTGIGIAQMAVFDAAVLLAAPGNGTWLVPGAAPAAGTVMIKMHRTQPAV